MPPKNRKPRRPAAKPTATKTEKQKHTLTARHVIDAGEVTDELIAPFVEGADEFIKQEFVIGVKQYCRWLDSLTSDEKAVKLDQPICEA